MRCGCSHDDIGGFVTEYVDREMLPVDPLHVFHREGVGALVPIRIGRGGATLPGHDSDDHRTFECSGSMQWRPRHTAERPFQRGIHRFPHRGV